MSKAEARSCAVTALTQPDGHSQPCANPFCPAMVENKSPQGKHGRYCCDRCRLDGYVLRRARAMMQEVGIEQFKAILQDEKRERN